MKSKAETFGAALGKAIRKTADSMKESGERRAAAATTPPIYRINRRNVSVTGEQSRKHGWTDAQVQLLIDKASAGADQTLGWTVLKPGGRYERHRHRFCDAFIMVLKGRGHICSELGEEPVVEGEVVYAPRRAWHGFNNTSDDEVVLLWGLMGAGSFDASGYEAETELP